MRAVRPEADSTRVYHDRLRPRVRWPVGGAVMQTQFARQFSSIHSLMEYSGRVAEEIQ